MNNENGQINFTVGLDDTEAVQGAERLGETFEQTGDSAEGMGARIDTAFEQTGKGAENAAKRVDDAFKQQAMSAKELSAVIETQNKVVSQLRDEYEKAKKAADEAFDGTDVSKYNELVEAQEKLKAEYDAEVDALTRLNAQREAMETSGDAEQSIRMQLRMTTAEITSLTLKYRALSAEEKQSAEGQEMKRHLEELIKKAGDMRDAMDDVNRSIKATASDTGNFDAIAEGLNVVTSTAGAAQGVFSMLGVSQEALMDIQTKLQASLAISNGLSVIQNNLQKESALMLGIRKVQEYAAAKAIAVRTAAEGKGIIATKAATVAQRAFNLVARANPYVLLATACLTGVGAIVAFTRGTKEATDATAKQRKEAEKLAEAQRQLKQAIGTAVGNIMGQYMALQKQWENLSNAQEKNKWIDENKGKFNQMGLSIKDINDAEKAFVSNSQAVIAALKSRAEAEAWGDIYKERIRKKFENDSNGNVANGRYRYVYNQGDTMTLQEVEQLLGRDLSRAAGGSLANGAYLGTVGVHFGTSYKPTDRVQLSARAAADLNNAAIEKQNALLQAEADGIDEAERKMVESQQAAVEAQKAIADLIPKGNGGGGRTGKTKEQLEREAQQALEAYNKALEAGRKAQEDANAQAEEDETKRQLAQMAIAHRRVLAEIEREQAELLEKKKAAQGNDATLTEDELQIFRDRTDAENTIYQRSLDERARAAAEKEKADMEAYLIEYGTYQQRVTAIHERYADLRNKATTEGEKLSLAAQEQAEIDAVNQRFGYATQAMADLFADASKKSVKEIQKIIDKYETLIDFMQGQKAANTGTGTATPTVTTDQLKGLGFTDEDIRKVQSGEISIKDLTDAIKALKGELGDRSPWMTFQKGIEDAIKKLKEGDIAGGISGIGDAVTQFTPAVKELGDQLGEAFGFDTGGFDDAMQMLQGLGTGAQAAGQIMSGDFVGGAMSAVSAISQIGGAITNMIDRKHEKRIQELQKQIDKLEESYIDLEKAVSRTYSFVKQKNIDLEIESKKNQIALIKNQIQEERDKKKTDNGKIEEWEKKIRELERDIEDLREQAVDAIFGEDVQAAIENFASAYAEAWSNSEDKAKSAKETVKNMMKQMVTESIKSAIQASGAMERIRAKLQEFYADNVLSPWEQEYVMNMAEQLQRDLDRQFGWADSLFSPDKSSSQDSTSRGFEAMSQDSADELNGRFTGIQMETSEISRKFDITNEHHAAIREQVRQVSEGMSQMVELQGVAISHLEAIERNTNELPEMNERLSKIEKNTRSL